VWTLFIALPDIVTKKYVSETVRLEKLRTIIRHPVEKAKR